MHQRGCALRDRWSELKKLKAHVFGVSTDSAESHIKFKDKFDLPFPLLVDEDHAMSEKYAWREKHVRQEIDGDPAIDLRD